MLQTDGSAERTVTIAHEKFLLMKIFGLNKKYRNVLDTVNGRTVIVNKKLREYVSVFAILERRFKAGGFVNYYKVTGPAVTTVFFGHVTVELKDAMRHFFRFSVFKILKFSSAVTVNIFKESID